MQDYVHDRVSHADRRTAVLLPCWRLLAVNTETDSLALRNAAFLG